MIAMHPAPPLSAVASYFAGKPVHVFCSNTGQDFGESDGVRTIVLNFDGCNALLYVRDRGPDNIDAANASATLGHEIGHIKFGSCESKAENYAMRIWRAIFRRIVGHAPDKIDSDYVWSVHESLRPINREPCR